VSIQSLDTGHYRNRKRVVERDWVEGRVEVGESGVRGSSGRVLTSTVEYSTRGVEGRRKLKIKTETDKERNNDR
jgi:hypothetical protein